MATRCQCLGDACTPSEEENGCLLTPEGNCFAYVDVEDGQKGWIMGCLPGDIEGILQCKGALTRHHNSKSMKCCRNEDYCNSKLIDTVEEILDLDVQHREYEASQNSYQTLVVYGLFAFLFSFILYFLYLLIRNFRKRRIQSKKYQADAKISESSIDIRSKQFLHHGNTPLLPNFNGFIHNYKPISPFERNFNFTNGSSLDSNNSSVNRSGFKYFHLSSSLGSQASSSQSSHATQQTMINSSGNCSNPTSLEDSANSGIRGNYLHRKSYSEGFEYLAEISRGTSRIIRLAKNLSDKFAIKVYQLHEWRTWEQEGLCYECKNLRNPYILPQRASVRNNLELWIVSEYLPMGSLRDYLKQNTINSVKQLLSLYHCIISGLFHLHHQFRGTLVTVGIAHRDLKSSTILMRSPEHCVISDLGLSVITNRDGICQPPVSDFIPYPPYMAPEVLNNSITPDNFKSHCAADIYSMGLVFWEIYNRLSISGPANRHQIPFEEYLKDKSISEMIKKLQKVVCEDQMRPQFDLRHENNETIITVQNIIKNCWYQRPTSRFETLRVKKELSELFEPHEV